MYLAWAIMTFGLLILAAFAAGASLGGPLFGLAAALGAALAIGLFLYQTYWPQIQQGFERFWKLVAFTGEK